MIDAVKYAKKKIPTSYTELLYKVQTAQTNELWEHSKGNYTKEERKENVLSFYLKQIHDQKVHYEGFTEMELVNRLYNDIEEYSVLTEPLNDENVEGINVNAWNNIRVKYHSGKEIKLEPFLSPQHAFDIARRLLQNSEVTIDGAVPISEASIGSNIRITAVASPIVDDDVGVAMYIRKLRDDVFTADEYIKKSFATHDVLKMIMIAVRRGVSTLLLGKVNTGKTTLLKHVLHCMPDNMEVITIEAGAREMKLIKTAFDENGAEFIVNNVVHMLTRHSVKEEEDITQEKLVVKSLRLDADIISVAEMRDIEAFSAVEASNSGHVVVSTAHAGSFKAGHKRIANLSRKKYSVDFNVALRDAVDAFPLGVFIHTTEDGTRRIMDLSEAYIDENDNIRYNCLWCFDVDDNKKNDDGSITVVGEGRRVNKPSNNIISHMKMYGITKDELAFFCGDGGIK